METPTGDVRQRALALIQEAGTLLGLIPHLVDRTQELESSLKAAADDADGLRGEIAALRSEAQQLRTDREEMADSLTVIMNDILRLTSEAVAKLRPTEKRTSFWREGPTPSAESTAARPGMGTPWRREG